MKTVAFMIILFVVWLIADGLLPTHREAVAYFMGAAVGMWVGRRAGIAAQQKATSHREAYNMWAHHRQ